VFVASCVERKRPPTDRSVVVHGVVIERLETHGRVETARFVGGKGSLPQGHVQVARGVEDKGIFTYRRVVAAVVVQQCLSTHGRVVSATGVQLERGKAESRVELANGSVYVKEGIKSLSRVEAVIESIRCRRRQKLRRSCLCPWQERKARQRDRREREINRFCYCFHGKNNKSIDVLYLSGKSPDFLASQIPDWFIGRNPILWGKSSPIGSSGRLRSD